MSGAELAVTQPDIWALNNPAGTKGLVAVDKVGGAIRFYDPSSLVEIGSIAAENHHELAVDVFNGLAYSGDFGKFRGGQFVQSGQSIDVFDLATRSLLRRIDTATFKGPHAMRFDGRGGLWVIFEETGEIGRIDLGEQELAEVYNIGAGQRRPPTFEITPDAGKIYVSSKLGNIIVFDTRIRSVIAEIAVPKGTEGMSISPSGDKVVVAENSKQHLLVIDTASNRIVKEIPLVGSVLSNPLRSRMVKVRYSVDGRFLVSANYASGIVQIHDGDRLEEQVIVPVEKGPMGIAFKADRKTAVVTSQDCGSMTVIDMPSAKASDWRKAGEGIESLMFY
ncbi:hypothetical protein QBK99_25590 [Corticibacterium sp. UT-5YL-CI-8]|nr:hypothetical protein [Tianweitania sp. UT-5YL-CI-8]